MGQIYDMLCAIDQSVQALGCYISASAGLRQIPHAEQMVC